MILDSASTNVTNPIMTQNKIIGIVSHFSGRYLRTTKFATGAPQSPMTSITLIFMKDIMFIASPPQKQNHRNRKQVGTTVLAAMNCLIVRPLEIFARYIPQNGEYTKVQNQVKPVLFTFHPSPSPIKSPLNAIGRKLSNNAPIDPRASSHSFKVGPKQNKTTRRMIYPATLMLLSTASPF